jgi:hypothetical protein
MSSILKRKSEAECTLVGTKEDGTKSYLCRVDEGKVFEVNVDKAGNISIDAKFVLITKDEYEKIHNALKKGQPPSAVV